MYVCETLGWPRMDERSPESCQGGGELYGGGVPAREMHAVRYDVLTVVHVAQTTPRSKINQICD